LAPAIGYFSCHAIHPRPQNTDAGIASRSSI
jgi:hypothetical protein